MIATRPSPSTASVVRVERVQRLAELEHHVVGDVDDVVDRSARPQPSRARRATRATGRSYAADEPRGVARAQLRRRRSITRHALGRGRRPTRREPARAARRDAPRTAPTSRATPAIDRQSGRFGVTSSSRTVSASPWYSANGIPTGASAGRISSPLASAPSPSSVGRAVHALARDAAQLGLLDSHAVGQRRADERHRHLVAGLEVLRAAHDLQRLARRRRRPCVTHSLSASGWCSLATTCPTTTPSSAAPASCTASTAVPVMSSRSTSSGAARSTSTSSFSHFSETRIFDGPSAPWQSRVRRSRTAAGSACRPRGACAGPGCRT